jgi:hypothetical protein
MGCRKHSRGDPKLAPPVPQHSSGWALGKPDLIIVICLAMNSMNPTVA